MKMREAAVAGKLWNRIVQIDTEVRMIQDNCSIQISVDTIKASQGYTLFYAQRNSSPNHLENADRLWEIVKGALLDRLQAEKVELQLKLSRMGVNEE